MTRRIISSTKSIEAASKDDKHAMFKDKMDQLKDDFDYILIRSCLFCRSTF